jgi:hypothetical protein
MRCAGESSTTGNKAVPAPVRLKKCRGRDVGRVLRKRVAPLKKVLQRLEKLGLLRQWKPGRVLMAVARLRLAALG